MKTYAALAIAALGSLALATLPGCVVTGSVSDHHHPVVVERPAPVIVERPAPVVVAQPAPVVVAPPPAVIVQQPPTQVIVVRQAPPPPPVEVIAPRPSAEVVWIPGYYSPQGATWVWVKGHYERPPRPGAVWVPTHHETHGTDIHFSVGFWR